MDAGGEVKFQSPRALRRMSERSDNLMKKMVQAFLVLLLFASAGCVERRLIVRSDPIGAKVFLDGEAKGETPATILFTYYGTREVVIRAPERKVARVVVSLKPPWYELTPLDFVSELLIPWTIVDEHVIEAKLEPAPAPTPAGIDELKKRAEERRKEGT